MIGVFDSGVGGICAFRELRRLMPREDMVYLADRKNAPYGTKDRDEIIALVKANVKRLRSVGARRILIACCTASTVYGELEAEERDISTPIIPAAVRKAVGGRRIAVIATERTVKERAFSKEIAKISDAEVTEIACQRLVALVEGGCRDRRINGECDRELRRICDSIDRLRADIIILGCTHFSHLEGEFKKRCGIRIISPAREGALALVKELKSERPEGGRIIYT